MLCAKRSRVMTVTAACRKLDIAKSTLRSIAIKAPRAQHKRCDGLPHVSTGETAIAASRSRGRPRLIYLSFRLWIAASRARARSRSPLNRCA